MRKSIVLLLIILLLMVSLVACDPSTVYVSRDDLSDIVSVELIKYNNPNQKSFISWVPDHTSDLKSFDNSKISVLETLDDDKFQDFFNTLCECPILDRYYAYDSPNGNCLKLTYSNGDFMIVSCNEGMFGGYIGKFTFDGKVIQFIGCFTSLRSFENLVNDYFITKI